MSDKKRSFDLVADIGEGFGRYKLLDDKESLDDCRS